MTEYPYVRAAFINAIAEEGTKEEAVSYLQKQWNENCALRAEIERLTKRRDQWRNACLDANQSEIMLRKRAEKAEAERDEARAQVAATLEAAADTLQDVANNWDCGHMESRLCDCARDAEQWGFAADEVRSLTPANAKAALEAYGREKVLEGMQRVLEAAFRAQLGRPVNEALKRMVLVLDQNDEKGPIPDTALMFCWMAAQDVRAALRALKGENDG